MTRRNMKRVDGAGLKPRRPGSPTPWRRSAWGVALPSPWCAGATTADPAAGSSAASARLTRSRIQINMYSGLKIFTIDFLQQINCLIIITLIQNEKKYNKNI